MPNRSYCGAMGDLKMADCNLSLPYLTAKNDEKLCKYSYASWCPTCDKESPRRRTRSETIEPCRRKGKEMKTFTPKKYNRCQEFENMELEYNMKDLRFDCCRIRSNLCELPTTYISNNGQLFNNMSNLTKVSSGNSDYPEKLPKTYDNSYKLNFNHTSQNLSMSDKHIKTAVKSDYYLRSTYENQKCPKKMDTLKPHHSLNGFNPPNYAESRKTPPRSICKEVIKTPTVGASIYLNSTHISNSFSPLKVEKYNLSLRHNQNGYTCNYKPGRVLSPSHYDRHCDEQARSDNPSDHCTLCYDTCTFFDRRELDTRALNERYFEEVDIIREKLKEIRKERNYKRPNREIIEIKAEDDHNTVEIVKNKVKTEVPSCEIKKTQSSANEKINNLKSTHDKTKSENKKITVKARSKIGAIKLRQIRNKMSNGVTTGLNFTESYSEDSEAELSEKEESEGSHENSKICTKEKIQLNEKLSDIGAGDGVPTWPIRESLFPNIPPYISFNTHDAEVPFNVPSGRRYLKWKLSTITPIVVRKTLTNTGFRLVRKSNEWLGSWGKHMKSPLFQSLKDIQKLNHFPGTFQIGRKDRLWRNFQRLINRFGHKEFGFIPETFVLPQDLKLLKQNWEHKNGSGEEIFIIKPPASARGVGIKVINKWSQLPKKISLVVQRYISNPYLINGSKFDLRLYVLVTSFNPLRIYLYPDGLARFASAKYNADSKDLKDRYVHLTNYSINKLSSQYTANEDANACQGHKWTLSKLWEFMEKDGIDTKVLWRTLENLVIKTMISGESPITQLCKENLTSRYNCYELFGVDILLDDRLKPWLLEVNISPSLHSASPLDAYVKGPLVKALFDIAQFHLPPRLKRLEKSPPCFEPKLYTMAHTKRERNKHNYFTYVETRQEYLDEILDHLNGDDVRHLTQAEDELTVIGPFNRIFPTSQTYKYLDFMEPRYYNKLFDAWECRYENNRMPGIKILQSLCAQKIHLKVATQSTVIKNLPSTIPAEMGLQPSTEGQSHPCDIDNLIQITSLANP